MDACKLCEIIDFKEYVTLKMAVADFKQGKKIKKFDGLDNWFASSIISFVPIVLFSLLKALIVNKEIGDVWNLIISDYEIYFIYVTMISSSMLNLFVLRDKRKWRKFLFVAQLIGVVICGIIYGVAKWNDYTIEKLAGISISTCILIVISGIFSFCEKKEVNDG